MQRCVSACNPPCADGQLCTDAGQCVSACNPPCAAGERCTSQGECLAPPPPPPVQQRVSYMPGSPAPRDEIRPSDDSLEARRTSGKRFHDGFYFRMGLGAGYTVFKVTPVEETDSTGGGAGMTVPVELAIGGSPTPGFVLGFGSYAVNMPGVTYTGGRGDFVVEEEGDYGSIAMLGPFADIYPAPRSGFHLQFAPCFTVVSPGGSDTLVSDSLSGIGFGAMVGLGYEGWVSDQWGLGILLRNQFIYAQISDEEDDRFNTFGYVPALLMTATLH
jgi:hypothetical protein